MKKNKPPIGYRVKPIQQRLAVFGLSMLVLITTMTGCTQSEKNDIDQNSASKELALPVSFVGTPGENKCEALQETEPSSSYRALAPMRSDTGDAVEISGNVLVYPTCQYVSGAIVEFWYAAKDGSYKDELRRGRLTTDAQGGFNFSVEMPGSYKGENGQPVPAHVHIWVSGIGILARGMAIMIKGSEMKTIATVVMPTGV